jgi:hypothetical protein
VNARSLQLFFLFTFCFLSSALTETGEKKIYALKFTDVDGRELSTADGHVTLLVFVNSGQVDKAQTVGDRVPDFCLGNNGYRMITVIEAKNHSAPLHRAFESVARHRLDAVAKRLQTRYDKKKIARNARPDVFAVIDFGGTIGAKFADQSSRPDFRLVVLRGNGDLRQQWLELPTAKQLAVMLK